MTPHLLQSQHQQSNWLLAPAYFMSELRDGAKFALLQHLQSRLRLL